MVWENTEEMNIHVGVSTGPNTRTEPGRDQRLHIRMSESDLIRTKLEPIVPTTGKDK